ncbi:hypothetical protein HYV86_07115 [Candidatus Woesearchaeota archaeon]|nr:hypothetical protein [Candidatus Woesearchaeota archaeon]
MKEKVIFFDTGPIISLITSRMSFILPEIKKQYNGRFYITPAVKLELIDRPLTMNRYKFEALQVLKLLRDGVLELYEDVPKPTVRKLITLANTSFYAEGKSLDVLQEGEIESVACALKINADAVIVDERALRWFIEDSKGLQGLFSSRFKKPITTNEANIQEFSTSLKDISIFRSIELVCVAYKLGSFKDYKPDLRNPNSVLLDALLWTIKSNGCAVSEEELEDMKRYLLN